MQSFMERTLVLVSRPKEMPLKDSFSICFVGTYTTSVQPQAPKVLDPPGFIKSSSDKAQIIEFNYLVKVENDAQDSHGWFDNFNF
ncbi:unnamed protein product [Brassica oleracea]